MGKAGGLLFLILAVGLGVASLIAVTRPEAKTERQLEVKSDSNAAPQPSAPLADRRPDSAMAQNLGSTPTASDEFTSTVHEALTLSARLDQVQAEGSTEIDDRVTQLAAKLTLADASQLQEIAKASNRSHNSRYLAVYLISQRPELFAHQLEDVAASESAVLSQKVQPHTQAEQQRHFEEALRAQALVALDQLNLIDNREKPFFSQLRESHSNPFIGKLAGMGMVGADQRQTLITRFINNDH